MMFNTEFHKDLALEWIDGVKACLGDVRWSLTCGVLLGAVRGGEFIDWDFDIDLMMYREDEEKMPRVVDCLKARGFKAALIVCRDDRPTITQLQKFIQINHQGVPGHIALRDPSNFKGRKYFPFEKVMLRGKQYPCPGNVRKFLEEMYGPDWRTPKPTPGWTAAAGHMVGPGHPVPEGAWHD